MISSFKYSREKKIDFKLKITLFQYNISLLYNIANPFLIETYMHSTQASSFDIAS